LSELVLLLLKTDWLQQFEDFCQSLFWSVFCRSRTSPDKNLQIVEGGQYLVEVEQALTKIFELLKDNLKISVRACPSTKYGQLSTI
jgi:hypothetical protein